MNIEKYFEDFHVMNWVSKELPGGGFEWELITGAKFKAGISMFKSDNIMIAEASGLKSQFRLTLSKSIPLNKDDIIHRVKDGKNYSIKTETLDNMTPDVATVQFATCRAERVD